MNANRLNTARYTPVRARGIQAGYIRVIGAGLAALALAGCSTLTVRADLSEQVSGNWTTTALDGRDLTHQPVARIAIAFEPELSRTVSASLGFEHRSYPFSSADRGDERVYVGLAWKPFRGDP